MGRREEEIELLKKYKCPLKDDLGTFGVLLSDEIEHYVYLFKLIDPFDCKNNGIKEFRYGVSINKLADILPCPQCNKTRELISKE